MCVTDVGGRSVYKVKGGCKMTASIFLIKTALLRFGVVIEGVKFDVDNEKVDVNYTQRGQQQIKSVPFSQIEALFTSAASPPADAERPYYAPPEQ